MKTVVAVSVAMITIVRGSTRVSVNVTIATSSRSSSQCRRPSCGQRPLSGEFVIKPSACVKQHKVNAAKSCTDLQCLHIILCKKTGGAYANYFHFCVNEIICDVTDAM